MSKVMKSYIFIVLCILLVKVYGHGRLVDPPSRSSMWRFGFDNPTNYNDNELFCGGAQQQWERNGGRCGVCGDAFNLPQPRPNEAGGLYGNGIIVKRYKTDQIIKATVDLTANHLGFMEFRICPNNNPKKIVNQNCLDHYPLQFSDGSGTRFNITKSHHDLIDFHLQLPKGLKCTQCVLQWHYQGANNWDKCSDGTYKLGCGPQETFRGCADVAIA